MQIAIIQGAFFPIPPLRGGAVEKIWHRLGAEFVASGHSVIHISRLCDGLSEQSVEQGVFHRRVHGSDQPANGLWLKVRDWQYSRKAVRKLPASDIVVTNTFWSPIFLRHRPGVYVDVQRMPKGQMRFYRNAARLRANSQAVREAILKEEPNTAPRVCVIPNPLPFDAKREVDWSRKEKTILYVGRLHPEKGIELLLEAFASRTDGALSGWTMELVGPAAVGMGGGGEAWLDSLKKRFNKQRITWRGPIYNINELNNFYERAAIFAYPSLAEEGETFGSAPLEAMAWGATPLVSSLACFRDFIHHGENGLAFDHRGGQPVKALNRMMEVATRMWPEYGRNAVEVRKSHAAPKIAELFLDDFRRVLATQAEGLALTRRDNLG